MESASARHRPENQGTWRLARQDACESAQSHPRGRPRDRRRVEVGQADIAGTPVFSHGGIVCTGETYKNAVKLTFAKGAALQDPARLFNSSLEGNVRRAIDIHEDDKINEAALKDLIRAAVALNLAGKTKPKPQSGPKKKKKKTASSA